ncbi:hypothetical protein FHT70_004163 [Rhizobium sp. BK049]|uniref:hypothetical protein n=1 Tax=Rhizobium sp. BK049 TaxID=2587095 RepID=UPI001614EDFA|nr:hypothetical protein [Rhizobium sp. BK049]MBB3354212.1 hypothetical protein [Rhizobium sp. BK049]
MLERDRNSFQRSLMIIKCRRALFDSDQRPVRMLGSRILFSAPALAGVLLLFRQHLIVKLPRRPDESIGF